MFFDNKGKLFGKVNIIDACIILLLIVVIAVVGFKFIKGKTISPFTELDNIQTEFFCEEVPDAVGREIKIGDLVKDPITNAVIGHVMDVKVKESMSYGTDSSGKWVVSSKAGYVSITMTVEGSGVYNDGKSKGGITFDNSDFWIGRGMELRVGNEVLIGRIYKFTKIV